MTGSTAVWQRELSAAISKFPPRTLGVLLVQGFHPLDLWGPLEMFSRLSPAVSPVLVGSRDGPVRGAHGAMVMVDVTLGESSFFDLLLVPGGVQIEDAASTETLEWLSWLAPDAELVMAVGEGTALLASTGLLDGRRASAIDGKRSLLARAHPAVKWVTDDLWVEDGRFVTAWGGFAAIDMSLAVISRLVGEATAAKVAAHSGYRSNPMLGSSPGGRPVRP